MSAGLFRKAMENTFYALRDLDDAYRHYDTQKTVVSLDLALEDLRVARGAVEDLLREYDLGKH